MYHKIPTQVLQKLLDYLATRPYKEVAELVDEMHATAIELPQDETVKQQMPEIPVLTPEEATDVPQSATDL